MSPLTVLTTAQARRSQSRVISEATTESGKRNGGHNVRATCVARRRLVQAEAAFAAW